MMPQVPHGFDNREQYERTLLNPLGKDWNAMEVHSKNVAPKVRMKLGAIIQPLKFQRGTNSKKVRI